MDIWIFANGEIEEYGLLRERILAGSVIIAADGGLQHIRKMEMIPDVVIGDLDSVTDADLEWLKANSIEIIRYPADKDETDLELAISFAVKSKNSRIRIAGGAGGRTDQLLGNIFLLLQPELSGMDIKLDDGVEETFLIRSNTNIQGSHGDVVSLLPLNGSAVGITTSGLKYPLYGETLYPEKTRGVSNVMLVDLAAIQLEKGVLLCVHTRKRK